MISREPKAGTSAVGCGGTEFSYKSLGIVELLPCDGSIRMGEVEIPWHIADEFANVYPTQEDWVFASPTMKGEQPYWPDNLLKRCGLRQLAAQCDSIDLASGIGRLQDGGISQASPPG